MSPGFGSTSPPHPPTRVSLCALCLPLCPPLCPRRLRCALVCCAVPFCAVLCRLFLPCAETPFFFLLPALIQHTSTIIATTNTTLSPALPALVTCCIVSDTPRIVSPRLLHLLQATRPPCACLISRPSLVLSPYPYPSALHRSTAPHPCNLATSARLQHRRAQEPDIPAASPPASERELSKTTAPPSTRPSVSSRLSSPIRTLRAHA